MTKAGELERRTAALERVQGIEDAVNQLDELLQFIDDASLVETAGLDLRLHLLREAGKRVKASHSTLVRLGITHVRLSRRMGHHLLEYGTSEWKAAADEAGINHHNASRARSLADYPDDIFEQALADVIACGSIPSPELVRRRGNAYTRPGGLSPGAGWRDRFENRDADWWDERNAQQELAEQVALEAAEVLNTGTELTMADLCQRVINEDPELILALDPPGMEVMRQQFKKLSRRRGAERWPLVYTSTSNRGFTYTKFEHATVGHARADLTIKRENLLRVLIAYRSLRRLVRTLDGLPDSTPLAEVAMQPDVLGDEAEWDAA